MNSKNDKNMFQRFKKLVTFTDDYQNKEDIILRDHLAMERTKLANERTLLAYVRSSLYLILAGFAFLGMTELSEVKFIGYFSLVMSLILFVIGVFRFQQLKKHLRGMYRKKQINPTTED